MAQAPESEPVSTNVDEVKAALEAVGGEEATNAVAEAAALLEEPVEGEVEPEPVEQETAPQATEPEASEEEPSGGLAKGWAAVKAAEKRNRELRQQVKAERAELDLRSKQIEESRAKGQDYLARIKQNPLEVLTEAGLTFDDLARRVLNNGNPSATEIARQTKTETKSEVEQLREKLEKLENSIEAKRNEDAFSSYTSQVETLLQADDYALLSTVPGGAMSEVMALTQSYAAEHNKVLPPKEACDMILGEWRNHLASMSTHKAVREILGAPDGPQQSDTATSHSAKSNGARPKGTKPRTLTNALASSPAKGTLEPDVKLSEHEELAEAAKLLQPDATQFLSEF